MCVCVCVCLCLCLCVCVFLESVRLPYFTELWKSSDQNGKWGMGTMPEVTRGEVVGFSKKKIPLLRFFFSVIVLAHSFLIFYFPLTRVTECN